MAKQNSRKTKKMTKKADESLISKAYMLSFAQLSIFAIVFAAIGGVAVWRSNAAKAPTGTCAYSPAPNGGVVSASGLPKDSVLNFLTHDNVTGAQTGWVLGVTHDGTWTVNVPAPAHSSTYDFISKTYGKDGSKYYIYAECTQSI